MSLSRSNLKCLPVVDIYLQNMRNLIMAGLTVDCTSRCRSVTINVPDLSLQIVIIDNAFVETMPCMTSKLRIYMI